MAKVNQSHLLLATVFLVLGTVVHDVSTATVNKDLEVFIQKSSRMIAAPFPSKSGAPGNDASAGASSGSSSITTEQTTEISATGSSSITTEQTTEISATSEETSSTTPASVTTGKISTTTAAPQTTTEALLPSDDIWKEIEKELNEITGTLNELKEFVDNVTATTTTTTAGPTASTTGAPEPTTTAEPTASTTGAPEPTTTAEPTASTTGAPEPTTKTKPPAKARQMIPPLYFLSKIDLGIFKEEQEICKSDDPADLCERLTKVLKNVEDIGNKIPDLDEATMKDLNIVRGNKTELTDVSNSMQENPSFVTDNLDVKVFDSRVETVNETIATAIDDIDSKLSETDNTLAIVLGTIFGILGVALIIGAIVMFRKKNKRKQGTSMNMERNVNPSSRHSSQSGE